MQQPSYSSVKVPPTRIAHKPVAPTASLLPQPLHCINKNIPLSLRKDTLEKMYSTTMSCLKELADKNSKLDSRKFPFVEMTYEREQVIASKNVKKSSYVAEMASHLLYLKKQAIPKWITRISFISEDQIMHINPQLETINDVGLENIGKIKDKNSEDIEADRDLLESDSFPSISIPQENVSSNPVIETGMIIVLGMPQLLIEIQNYLLTKEQALKAGMPTKDTQIIYKISPENSISSDSVSCDRCGIGFIPSNYYVSDNPSSCAYHAGKFRWPQVPNFLVNSKRNTKSWSCCEGGRYSTACSLSPLHVFRAPSLAQLETDSVSDPSSRRTISFLSPKIPAKPNTIKIMGIDCEMVCNVLNFFFFLVICLFVILISPRFFVYFLDLYNSRTISS